VKTVVEETNFVGPLLRFVVAAAVAVAVGCTDIVDTGQFELILQWRFLLC
jgi:hypothetical protein